jgi:uncharacterized protein (DUF885 family)
MFRFFAAIIVISSSLNARAMAPAEFRAHADTVIESFARFDPVWATNMGIHTYDSHLADYSKSNVDKFILYLKNENKTISQIDTSGWPIDDIIDHKLLLSNIKFQLFQLETFPYWKKSPSIYSDQCLSGIYYLALRNFAPLDKKLPSFLGRLNQIPAICKTGKENLTDPVPIFLETSTDAIDEGINLIRDISDSLAGQFPIQHNEILSSRDKAIDALKDFNLYCTQLKINAKGNFAIGRKNLEFLLHDIHLLNIDSDSLLTLGNNIFANVDSQMQALTPSLPPPDTLAKFPLPSLDKNDVLSYDQWEINKVKDFVIQRGIATLPANFGLCIPRETPPFLRGVIRGIAYEPPAPLDSVQTGYFYIRPLPDTFTLDQKAAYNDYICRRGFRGSIVHEGYPGHHMQLQLADMNPSKIRKLQQDLIFVEGWALYCEEMTYHQGLFGQDLNQWNGILGGIRFRAIRIIVDIGLQTGRFTPQTALDFMNEKLGKNDYYYTAEIRRYCANPTQALSYLTGKTLITNMRENAARKEGDKFDLKAFHDKLLSEGSIPPPLIAQKYGW